jgi:dihydrofolate reductase
MNSSPKVVFSRSLNKDEWNNTRLASSDIEEEVRKKIERSAGEGHRPAGQRHHRVAARAQRGLIDEYRILVNLVVLGQGTTLFAGIRDRLNLKRLSTRAFRNGNVLLCYEPAEKEK